MKIALCTKELCTACEACAAVCPQACISMEMDAMGALYPRVDEHACIRCGACSRVCPAGKPVPGNPARVVYAGWNTDLADRRNAASGGIATAIYRYALSKGIVAYGVADTETHEPQYIEIQNERDIERCQNSKYVFSRTGRLYNEIRAHLQNKRDVILIGLPCQIAGLKSYLGRTYENLTTVDLICHGTCPCEYFRQHIQNIERKTSKRADLVSFRDPSFGTHTYRFTLRQNNRHRPFYRAKVNGHDPYQIGYHKGLIDRENCYHCAYAKEERVGDITIGDFSGLGREAPFEGENSSVSCLLCNTENGATLLQQLESERRIVLSVRPMQEAYAYERMLRCPTAAHEARETFETVYRETQDFQKAASLALAGEIKRNKSIQQKWKNGMRTMRVSIRRIVPDCVATFVKRMMK